MLKDLSITDRSWTDRPRNNSHV